MSLSHRLIAIVAASVGIAIVAVAVSMGLLARNALIEQAEDQAGLVAGLIAAEANRAELAADEINRVIAEEMEAQAIAVGHLTEFSDSTGSNAFPVAVHLAEVTSHSGIDDIWLLDRTGTPLLRAVGGLADRPARSPADAGIDRRVLDALISGRRYSIDFQSTPQGDWERPLRYVGVRAGDDRLVLIGSLTGRNEGLLDTIGLSAALNSLAGQQGVRAIWVVDDSLTVVSAVTGEPERGAPAWADLSPADSGLATQALTAVAARSYLGADALHVAAPILDRGGVATGAAVIRMPRDQLDRLFADHLRLGLIVAAAAFAIGSLIALMAARRITRPVMALTRAAAEVDARNFEPASLDREAGRHDELGALTRVFQTMAREVEAREEHLEGLVRERTLDLEEKNALLETAKQRMETELEIAHALQGAILHGSMPPHQAYAGDALMTPAWEMGGDFYDFFTLPDGRFGVVIADVSGKGVSAAFFMAITRTVVRAAAREHAAVGDCLREVNDVICAQNPHDLFVTLFYGVLDPATGQFSYANAGHNPPLLIPADAAVEALPLTGGVAIGVLPELSYDEHALSLSAGDTLFFYTDGISEAMDVQQREFTEQRLIATLAQCQRLPVDNILPTVTGAVDAFVGDAPQSDDITCVVLRFNGAL